MHLGIFCNISCVTLQVFADFAQRQNELKATVDDAKERSRLEQQASNQIELFLRGLCTFCPSIEGLQRLITRVSAEYPTLMETTIPMIVNRLRSLHFGPQDKEALKAMIREVGFMHSDECAIALLTNSHHPNDSFNMQEIIQFVKMVTESREGVRPCGHQLLMAMRRWLIRHFGRQPERERKEEHAKSMLDLLLSRALC